MPNNLIFGMLYTGFKTLENSGPRDHTQSVIVLRHVCENTMTGFLAENQIKAPYTFTFSEHGLSHQEVIW